MASIVEEWSSVIEKQEKMGKILIDRSKETENGYRLMYLLIELGTEALRRIFHMNVILLSEEVTMILKPLCDARQLSQLYPARGQPAIPGFFDEDLIDLLYLHVLKKPKPQLDTRKAFYYDIYRHCPTKDFLSRNERDLLKLRKGNLKVLHDHHWDVLFPKPPVWPDSEMFGMSLFCMLFRHTFKTLCPPTGTRWDLYPKDSSIGFNDDVLRLRLLRNHLFAHTVQVSLSDFDFAKYRKDVTDILLRLGVQQESIGQHSSLKLPLGERSIMSRKQLLEDVLEGTGFTLNDILDDSRKNYDEKEIKNLANCRLTKILVAGKKRAGKSSLVKTLIDNYKSKVNETDETYLMNHFNWLPLELNKNDRKHAVMIVDLGGHPVYETTAKFFTSNDEKNLIVIAHKITDYDFDTCFKWVTNLVYISPKCQFLFALTQIDLLAQYEKERSYEDKWETFKTKMSTKIDEEIKKVERQLFESRRKKNTKYKEYSDIKNALERIKEGISAKRNTEDQRVFFVCCNADGIEKDDESLEFRNCITHMCNKEYFEMTDTCQALYKKLCRIGLRKDEQTEEVDEQVLLIGVDDKVDKSLFCRSHNASSSLMASTSIPQHNINQVTEEIAIRKIPHIDIKEVENAYEKIQNKNDMKDSLIDCLRTLHSLGLIYWYEFTEQTKTVIFNDIPAFVDMMRSIFDHKLEENSLKWTSLYEEEQSNFTEGKYNKHHRQKLISNGILSMELLKLFLARHKIEHYTSSILQLLCHLKIAYKINEEEIFFPWYLKDLKDFADQQRSSIKQAIEWITHSDKSSLSRCLQFAGHIPKSTFYSLNVLLYDKLGLQSVVHNKYFWTNGMFVHLGSIALALVHNGNNKVYAFVKGNCETKCSAICDIWKLLKLVNSALKETSDSMESSHLLCTVCTSINKRRYFYDHIMNMINRMPSDFTLENLMCDLFEDEVNMTNLITPMLDRESCCGLQDSILFLPPVPYENLDDTLMEHGDCAIFKHLKQALNIFPHMDSGKFQLGQKCHLLAVQSEKKKNREYDCSTLYGLPYVSTLLEEDMFDTGAFVRSAICYLYWPGGTGTGFLLGSVKLDQQRWFLVLTCHHLLAMGLESAVNKHELCSAATAEFKLESKIQVKVSHICGTNGSLDYALLCLHPDMRLDYRFKDNIVLSTWIPAMKFTTDKHLQLTLMSHSVPDCSRLKIDNAIVDKEYFIKACTHLLPCLKKCSSRLVYKCCSFEGASGSPVTHLPKKHIHAMHASGDVGKKYVSPTVDDIRIGNEYGVLLYDIVLDIYRKISAGKIQDITKDDYFSLFPQFRAVLSGQNLTCNWVKKKSTIHVVRRKSSTVIKRKFNRNKPYTSSKKNNTTDN